MDAITNDVAAGDVDSFPLTPRKRGKTEAEAATSYPIRTYGGTSVVTGFNILTDKDKFNGSSNVRFGVRLEITDNNTSPPQ